MTEWSTVASLGIRPVLVPSQLTDRPEKVGFVDDHWLKVPGGRGVAEATDEVLAGRVPRPGATRSSRPRACIEERRSMTVDLLYGDHEGGQRTITRFVFLPDHDDGWVAAATRHWNLDRSDPR